MAVSDSKKIYQDLRTLALQGTREKLGLPPTQKPNDTWGVIMDWGLDQGPRQSLLSLTEPQVST